MTAETAVVEQDQMPAPMLPMPQTSTTELVLNESSMGRMMEVAKVMACGVATIPKHLQKNTADCMAVIMQAMQWRMNPFAVAQKTHLVNGILGYEAQLVNAVIQSMAPTKDRLHYEWFGSWEGIVGKFKELESKTKKDDDGHPKKYRMPAWDIKAEEGLGVRVWATLKGEDEPRELTLLMTQARTRNSPLWADDPKQQLAYLAVKRWSRLYCPDVILGVYTRDELDEVDDRPMRDITPPRTAAAFGEAARPVVVDTAERSKLIERLEKTMREKGFDALSQEWGQSLTKEQRKLVGPEEIGRIKAIKIDDPAPAGQSKAELLELLDIASNMREVSKVGESCAHLSDADRDEVHTACAEKLDALKGAANG